MHYIVDPVLTTSVTPAMYSGKDIHPFNSFSLSCTARKPASIIPSLQLSWYHDGTQLDDSVSSISIREENANGGSEKTSVLSITSASILNSGVYTCSAEVSIPDSNTVRANQTATITITGD